MSTTTIKETISDRDKKYGGFENVSVAHINFWEVFEKTSQKQLSPPHRIALDMIFHKLARIACGDPNYKDNWHDIAGYALLGEEHCKEGDTQFETIDSMIYKDPHPSYRENNNE